MSYEVIGWLIAIVVFIVAEAATVALVSVWFIGGAASSGRPNVRPANASKKAAT